MRICKQIQRSKYAAYLPADVSSRLLTVALMPYCCVRLSVVCDVMYCS